MSKKQAQKITTILLTLSILTLLTLRFVHIEADFPQNVTRSEVLFTDEGFYSNAAVAHQISGEWYIDGDFNPVVNMPVLHVVQRAAFGLFGLSLTTARLTIGFFFLISTLATYFLVRKYSNNGIAMLTVLLLAGNFTLFAYSRLAITETPMVAFVLLALWLASTMREQKHYVLIGAFVGVLFVTAVLTKTSALFAFPVLLLFIWRQREERREKLISTGIFALTAIILLANYAWLVTRLYPADYAYFTSLNINGRIALQPLDILHNLLKSLSRGFYIDKIMYPLIALLTPILLWRFPKFRQNDLIIMSVLWIASYFALVGTSTYQPPRYFIPLGVPIIILFSVSSFSLHKQLKHPLYTKALAATVTLILLMNVFQIGRYLQSPEYTFQDMATDIQHQIPAGSIIYGHMANSVGLATGNYSINERHGTQPNEWKFEQYKPTYYVALGETDTQFLLDAQYDVQLLADYAVFNNHASDKKVYLYQLIKRK